MNKCLKNSKNQCVLIQNQFFSAYNVTAHQAVGIRTFRSVCFPHSTSVSLLSCWLAVFFLAFLLLKE